MMLPGAVTLVPNYLIWKHLGFLGTTVPLWGGALFGSVFDLPRHEFSELVIAQLRGCESFRISMVVTGLNCGVVNENPLVGVGAFVIQHHRALPLARCADCSRRTRDGNFRRCENRR